jgi:phosphatidate cytidylyltransferase
MLKYRLPSGIVMAFVMFGSVFLKGNFALFLFLILGVFLASVGVYEYLSMIENIGLTSYKKFTALFAGLLLVMTVLKAPADYFAALLILSVLFAWFLLLVGDDRKKLIISSVTSISALPMLILPLYFLAEIYIGNFNSVPGKYYFLFLIVVTKIGDIGAYTVGMTSSRLMKNGNHKILPKISPKKSWEGTIGGLCFSIVAAFVFIKIYPNILVNGFNLYFFSLISGALLFIGGFIGDLTESSLKRGTNVKDSGKIIPGMGGALDVIDSLLLNAPIFYIFLKLLS